MPWRIEKRADQYCVIKESDGSNEGCHDTEEQAKRHQAALYATEAEAETVDFWDGAAAMKACETAADYDSICALDRGASIEALRARFGLPHHQRPGAPADRQGVAAAWAALAGGRTGSPMSGPGVPEARAHLASHRRAMGMGEQAAAEAATGLTFDEAADDIAATFQTNVERRTITGMFVPWGKVARSAGARWRFSPGSLHWSDPKRVKLNLGHDHMEAVGMATRIDPGTAGLHGTFKIARGEQGDRALALAEDGVLDGFSIEVDFDEDDGWTTDPSDNRIRLVQSGRLAGVALTAFPAFDDARVERVAAARKQGGEMTTEEAGPVQLDAETEATFDAKIESLAGKVIDAQTKLTQSLSQSVGESISAGVKAALEDIGAPQERGKVRAAKYSVTREPPVYHFNGAGESLVRDAWNAEVNHDEDAVERLRKWRKQTEEVLEIFSDQFSLNFAPQSTSTASQVIPPGYRPELYVADLFRERPYVASASRGVIQNAAPFSVPVFGSVTGASADHVEGTNPSDGSLSFTTRTVTPQAVSGRIVLTRELVDSSNPAIDQIALAEMRESYARQTEAKVYTMLNSTTGSGGTITAGFVPSGAQAATFASTGGTPYASVALINGIRTQLALYPFRRFAAPTAALMGSNATTLLATANDSTGRPIFPSIGATNTAGIGNAVTQGWSVDGLAFQPAWSNTGTAAGDSQIMIFNRADVWVWESPLLQFRFEEKQGPANIELNIFGYFGTHLLRPVGLSGIRIT